MKGGQIGGTEVGLNWIGYSIDQSPVPFLIVQPTVETAKRLSRQRISSLIELSPVLKDLVRPSRSRDSGNTLLSKEFQGGVLVITGASSAVGLRSMPVCNLFMDEIDGYLADVDGEGDPVDLALQRTTNFPNRKLFFVSTPTIKGFSRIEDAYKESDQRRYWVPCPECSVKQVLMWEHIRWPEGQRHLAFYQCEHCGASIQDYQKGWMLEGGVWIPENPGSPIAGFHLSSLYSPHGWASWGDIAVQHGQVYRDPVRLKVWVNTKLGETWEESAEQLDGNDLMERRERFGLMLPSGIVVLTAGVDVQDDRIEMEVVGWGRDEESWSVDYRVLWGDPSGPAVWQELEKTLSRPFPHSLQVSDLYIRASAIDTGGHHTLQAYAFCRTRQERRVWAIKGRGGMGVPIWPRRSSRNNKGKVPLFIVGVDSCKESIYARLRLKEPGPGYCHFPLDRDAEWFRQLTAEKITTRYHKGHPIREWIKKSHDRNEALDARVYSLAALHGLMSIGLQLNREADRLENVPMKSVSEEPVIRPPAKRPQRRVIQSTWM
jgi:phage terminase large subunit GpA-like protein